MIEASSHTVSSMATPHTRSGHAGSRESLLSSKAIPREERLIFALDVSSVVEAMRMVGLLGDTVRFYKLGLELFMAGGYFELVDWLTKQGKKVFVDLKFFDVPETVARAVSQLNGKGATFVTVHGNDRILEAACRVKQGIQVLAVTVLTSLDESDLKALGFQCDVPTLVLSRAKRALALGCDGVISSGLEARQLRTELGARFLIVTPGIRPVLNGTPDDQKRVVGVREAFLNGADYIVVGRPIKNAADPRKAATDIQSTIATLFSQ